MARVRHLVLGLASGSVLYSGMVPALGLGEITLHSALNQPFEAEIELLQVGDLGAGDMLVRLAPAEIFNRSGVERFYFLNDLRFTPLLRGSQSIIRVVSSRPVHEPYLNFIVEVARPGGQILREYTVLLDPPGSSAHVPVASSAQSQPAATSTSTSTSTSARPAVAPPSAQRSLRHQVASGDSLWLIANRLREQGSELSQQALMDGIHALNPTAFAGGDRNRLLAGVNLLLPDAARAVESVAAAQVSEPVDAPASALSDAPLAVSEPLGERAVVPMTPPQAEPGELQQLLDRQRQIDQELASQSAENLQLQQGLAQLQLQVQQLQEQLTLKDTQLAELGNQLAAAAPDASPAPVAYAPTQQPAQSDEGSASRTLLASILGLLMLLGALAWLIQRRKNTEPKAAKGKAQPKPVVPQVELPVAAVVASAPSMVPVAVEAAKPRAATPSDPLEAANVYIAYGRLSEARGVLEKALAHAPQRSDLRFRLLEVLAPLGDAASFTREEAVLRAEGFDEQQLEQLKHRHPSLQHMTLDTVEEVPAKVQALETADDFQLNLDDLSLDADWELVSPFQVAARNKGKVSAAPEPEAPFSSNLQELPVVLELDEHHPENGAFGELEMVVTEDEPLDEHFLDAFAGEADATAALQGDIEHLAGNPENMIKLNQALAYIEQGDLNSACDILNEVIDQGDDEQKQAARQLLAEIA